MADICRAVEHGLVANLTWRWTRIIVMAVDMWYMVAVMTMVVAGSADDDGGIWSGDDDGGIWQR